MEPMRHPTGFMSPQLSGKGGAFYLWSTAGLFAPGIVPPRWMGAAAPKIDKLYYGFDTERLYIRIELKDGREFRKVLEDKQLVIRLLEPEGWQFRLTENKEQAELKTFRGEEEKSVALDFAVEDVLEMSLPFKELGLNPGDRIIFAVNLISPDGDLVERFPLSGGFMEIPVPDQKYFDKYWYV